MNNEVYDVKFVWIDLITEDIQVSVSYYHGLFGWRAEISIENKDYYVFSVDIQKSKI